jgi:hypothetical protein
MQATDIKVVTTLGNCVQVMTLVDDQWMEFVRIWYGMGRMLESEDEASQWAYFIAGTLRLSNNQ